MNSLAHDIAPQDLRVRALGRLLDELSADGLTYQLRECDGEAFFGQPWATSDMAAYVASTDGLQIFKGSVEPSDSNISAVNRAQPRQPGFARFGEDRPLVEFMGLQAWRSFYEPFDISDHLRTLFFSEGVGIGYVAALRRGGERFTADEQTIANRLIPQIYDDLALARASETERRSCHLIVDESWNVVYASDVARAWLTPRRRDLLQVLGRRERRSVLDGMRVSQTRLLSDHPSLRYVALTPLRLARRDPLAHLSTEQREIARLAMAGLTNGEIARQIGRSRSTVKYHMTRIFELLGVDGRTSLMFAH